MKEDRFVPPAGAFTRTVQIRFSHCDPAGIVFFPNFSKWMDASSLNFFMQCGVPPWREQIKTRGIIGTPLLEIHTKFMRPATYGERIQVHTSIAEWRDKVVLQKHVVMRGDTVLCEAVRRMQQSLPREYDWCARLGGEEFAIVLPQTPLAGGEVVAQGSLADILGSEASLTGDYLSGRRMVEIPAKRRTGNGKKVTEPSTRPYG